MLNINSVYEFVFIFETENGIKGIVRADNVTDATERVQDQTGDNVVSIKRATEVENADYGCILFEDM